MRSDKPQFVCLVGCFPITLIVSWLVCSCGSSVFASQHEQLCPSRWGTTFTVVTRSVSEAMCLVLADAAGYVPDSVADKQPAGWELRQVNPKPIKGEGARRIALFREMEYPRDGEQSQTSYRYRLFIPNAAEDDSTQKKFPLLVWLHGYGKSGDDNWRQLIHIRDEVAKWEDSQEGFPCFVLAPQSPYEDHWGREIENVVMEIIAKSIEDFSIDPERVYLTGISSGGNATWLFGSNHPDKFAALVPMASASVTVDYAALAQVPVWTFRSAEDSLAPALDFRRKVAGIHSQGGSCWLTETLGRNHDCWTPAFDEYHIIEWMLAQNLGEPVVPIPWWAGMKSYQSRHLKWEEVWPPLVLVGVVVGLFWAVRRHLRMGSRLRGNDVNSVNDGVMNL